MMPASRPESRSGEFTVAKNLILLAVVLQFFLAISLPIIQMLYIVETTFNNSNNTIQEVTNPSGDLIQISLGIWGACYYSNSHSQDNSGNITYPADNITYPVDNITYPNRQEKRYMDWQSDRYLQDPNIRCFKKGQGFAYNVTIIDSNNTQTTILDQTWTGRLSFQIFAFVSSVVSVYFVPHNKHFVTLIAVGIAEGASILALAIDLAFFLLVKEKMRTLEVEAITNLGPGFWMAIFPPLLLGAAFLWLVFIAMCFKTYYKMEDQKEGQKLTGTEFPGKTTLSRTQIMPQPGVWGPQNPQGQPFHLQTQKPQLETLWESPHDTEDFPDTKSTTSRVRASLDIDTFPKAKSITSPVGASPDIETIPVTRSTTSPIRASPDIETTPVTKSTRSPVGASPDIKTTPVTKSTRSPVGASPDIETTPVTKSTRSPVGASPDIETAPVTKSTRSPVGASPDIETIPITKSTRSPIGASPDIEISPAKKSTRSPVGASPNIFPVTKSTTSPVRASPDIETFPITKSTASPVRDSPDIETFPETKVSDGATGDEVRWNNGTWGYIVR